MTIPTIPPRCAPIASVATSAPRTWALALAAGLAAGVIAWAIGEATLVPEAAYQNKKEHVHLSDIGDWHSQWDHLVRGAWRHDGRGAGTGVAG